MPRVMNIGNVQEKVVAPTKRPTNKPAAAEGLYWGRDAVLGGIGDAMQKVGSAMLAKSLKDEAARDTLNSSNLARDAALASFNHMFGTYEELKKRRGKDGTEIVEEFERAIVGERANTIKSFNGDKQAESWYKQARDADAKSFLLKMQSQQDKNIKEYNKNLQAGEVDKRIKQGLVSQGNIHEQLNILTGGRNKIYDVNIGLGKEYAKARANEHASTMASAWILNSVSDGEYEYAKQQLEVFKDVMDQKVYSELKKRNDAALYDRGVVGDIDRIKKLPREKQPEAVDRIKDRKRRDDVARGLRFHNAEVDRIEQDKYDKFISNQVASLIQNPAAYARNVNRNRRQWALNFKKKGAAEFLKMMDTMADKTLKRKWPARSTNEMFLLANDPEQAKLVPWVDIRKALENNELDETDAKKLLSIKADLSYTPDSTKGALAANFKNNIKLPGNDEDTRKTNNKLGAVYQQVIEMFSKEDLEKDPKVKLAINRLMLQQMDNPRFLPGGDMSYKEYATDNPYNKKIIRKGQVYYERERSWKPEASEMPEKLKKKTNVRWIDRYYPNRKDKYIIGWTYGPANDRKFYRIDGTTFNMKKKARK